MKPEERWNQEQAWTNSNDGILMELWKLRGHALARYGRNRHSLRLLVVLASFLGGRRARAPLSRGEAWGWSTAPCPLTQG